MSTPTLPLPQVGLRAAAALAALEVRAKVQTVMTCRPNVGMICLVTCRIDDHPGSCHTGLILAYVLEVLICVLCLAGWGVG